MTGGEIFLIVGIMLSVVSFLGFGITALVKDSPPLALTAFLFLFWPLSIIVGVIAGIVALCDLAGQQLREI